MKNKKRLLIIGLGILFLAVVGVLAALHFFHDSPPEPPEAYIIGEDSTPPFDRQLEHEDGGLTSIDTSPKNADETSPDTSYIYTYTDLNHPSKFTEQYVQSLTGEAEGFSIVDETLNPVDLPDFSLSEGTVLLAKPSSAKGRLFEISISWSEDNCVVTVSQPEGTLSHTAEPMLLTEAIEYFQSLNPASLGMPGTSMAEYQVYPIEGLVFVDGNACIKMSVYPTTGPRQTGQANGIFLMTGDKSHIYRLNPDTNNIYEVTPSS